MEIQNGILQPQLSNSSGESEVLVTKITISEINKPEVAVVWIQEVQYPRRWGWEYSAVTKFLEVDSLNET